MLEILLQNQPSAATKVVTQRETLTLAIFYVFWSRFFKKGKLYYLVLK